jgi:hypothetical protein
MRKYAAVLIACLVSLACHKNQSDPPPVSPPSPPSSDTVKTPVIIDSVRAIVACTINSSSHVITVFNGDGSLRWKKYVGGRGGLTAQTSYLNGRLFYTDGGYIYGFNIMNGDSLWRGYGNVVSPTVVYNGGVYACSASYGFFQMLPESGATYSSSYITNMVPYPPIFKDSIVFILSSTYTADYSITAYNYKTRKIKWTTPIGVNPPGGLTVSGDILCYTTYGSWLTGLNINTGAIQWQLKDAQYAIQLVNNNVIYAAVNSSPKSIIAINVASGAIQWRWQTTTPVYTLGSFYINDDQLVFEAGQNDRVIRGVKRSNGDSLWGVHEVYNSSMYNPIVAGGKLFRYKTDWQAPYANKIMIYDPATYKIKDSLPVEGDIYQSINIITKSQN